MKTVAAGDDIWPAMFLTLARDDEGEGEGEVGEAGFDIFEEEQSRVEESCGGAGCVIRGVGHWGDTGPSGAGGTTTG